MRQMQLKCILKRLSSTLRIQQSRRSRRGLYPSFRSTFFCRATAAER
ncbi:MAG: hypothetical protein JOZ78_05725 [Chroococcidiopsidaceae cyanobacterium CP_BM_ER_R8_30]|nr:hypothetical protein [Chroococcidiopsidaceae cyanobacterium CP_BM_ER_R8_30]